MSSRIGSTTVNGEVERFGERDREIGGELSVLDDHDLAGGVYECHIFTISIDGDPIGGSVDGGGGRRESWVWVFVDRANRSGREVLEGDGLAVHDRLITEREWRVGEITRAHDVDGEGNRCDIESRRSTEHGLRDVQVTCIAGVCERHGWFAERVDDDLDIIR